MSPFWTDGDAIVVVCDEAGWPVTFIWRGETQTIQTLANRWIVDEGWWRGRICRAYYKLTTDRGWLVVIYQDLLSQRWYLQRLYD